MSFYVQFNHNGSCRQSVFINLYAIILSCFSVCLSVENKEITCSSMNYQPASCPAGGEAVGITMTTKHSRSACVADKSYGLTDGMVWVKDGCRATFNVQYLDDGNGGFPIEIL